MHLDPADREQRPGRPVPDHARGQRLLHHVLLVADQPFQHPAPHPLRLAGRRMGHPAHLHRLERRRVLRLSADRGGAVSRERGEIRRDHGLLRLRPDADHLLNDSN